MTHEAQAEDKDDKKDKEITVEVNSKDVVLTEKLMTGLEIKQAAIHQQVQIQEDFVLQLEKHSGEFDTIGNHDPVHVKKGMRFTCIAPDDNS